MAARLAGNREIQRRAEEIVEGWFRTQGVRLVRRQPGERGFDLRTEDDSLRVEVKGSAREDAPAFRLLTEREMAQARRCREEGRTWQLHIVLLTHQGDLRRHLLIPASEVIEKARPTGQYALRLTRKDWEDFDARQGRLALPGKADA